MQKDAGTESQPVHRVEAPAFRPDQCGYGRNVLLSSRATATITYEHVMQRTGSNIIHNMSIFNQLLFI